MKYQEGDIFIVESKSDDFYFGYNIGETIVFQRYCGDDGGVFLRENGKSEQVVPFQFVKCISLNNKKSIKEESPTTDYLVAKVNFEGFSTSSSSKKTYYFKCLLTDLKKGDILVVDSNGAECNANFLGYANVNRIKVKPTKHVLRKIGHQDEVIKVDDTPLYKEGDELVVTKNIGITGIIKKGTVMTFVRFHKDGSVIVKNKNGHTKILEPDEVTLAIPKYDKDNESNLEFYLHNETEELFYEINEFHKKNLIDKLLEERDFEALKKVI